MYNFSCILLYNCPFICNFLCGQMSNVIWSLVVICEKNSCYVVKFRTCLHSNLCVIWTKYETNWSFMFQINVFKTTIYNLWCLSWALGTSDTSTHTHTHTNGIDYFCGSPRDARPAMFVFGNVFTVVVWHWTSY